MGSPIVTRSDGSRVRRPAPTVPDSGKVLRLRG
jgi:hypothetical protein